MLRFSRVSTSCVVCVLAGEASGTSFQGLGDLPGGIVESSATAVSADGQVVVGSSSSINGDEAFRWDVVNGMVGLGFGDLEEWGTSSSARAVSGDGAVIVGTRYLNFGATLGFHWDAINGMQIIWPFPGEEFYCSPEAVSSDGTVIVGWSSAGDNEDESFRWTAATGITPLENNPESSSFFAGAISGDGLVVAGQGRAPEDPSTSKAFRWDAESGPVALSPATPGISEVSAANADGSILVGSMDVYLGGFFTRARAFRWTLADGFVNLGTLGNSLSSTYSKAVNGDGTVIVGVRAESTSEAFIWREGIGMESLSAVLENQYGLDLTGWTLKAATGVSADGMVIVGDGTNPSGQPEGWIANLRAPAPACAGDVTGDGETNISDFNVLSLNFGQPVAPNTSGDLTGDGLVNIADFNILAGDFGCGTD